MQTFLPYPSFELSFRCLDWKRLGNQRRETKGILTILLGKGKRSWDNSPAVKMWEGYEEALKLYLNFNIREWVHRGYQNNMPLERLSDRVEMPWWLGTPEFHASHRANLLHKLPDHYDQFGWTEKPSLSYWWPHIRGYIERKE